MQSEADAHVSTDIPGMKEDTPVEPLPTGQSVDPAPIENPVPPKPVASRQASILLLVVVTAVSLAADLATKAWAHARLSGLDVRVRGPRRIEVISDHIDFIFAQNPGGAWSFLRSVPDALRRPFFLVVSAIAVVFLVSIYRRLDDDQPAMKWGLPLALGGALGNLVDRIRYGWVIDFIDIYVTRGGRVHHWPTFNVADIAIVIGVGLMAINMMWKSRHVAAKVSELKEPANPDPVPPIA